jgi:phage tail-like protein
MQIFTETGRAVFGPDANVRVLETGRRQGLRPITEEGRWLMGLFNAMYLETMELPVHIDFMPTVEAETIVCPSNWDLLKMMPKKFHNAPAMKDYLDSVSRVVNEISCRIDTLGLLIDVDTCPRKYLGHLAALIGCRLKNKTYATADELRRQIKMAVDIYKIKGTYEVLNYAFFTIGLNVQVYDLWTRDYQTFTRFIPHWHSGVVPGFSPEASLRSDDGWHFDENLRFDGGGGFKSPHFDIVINLTKLIMFQGTYNKLFAAELWPSIVEIMEQFTPVNTVPHFYLNLYCMCKEDYLPFIIPDSQVKTCITNFWELETLYFDMPALDDKYLDQPGVDVLIGTGDIVEDTFDSADIIPSNPQLMQLAGDITAFSDYGSVVPGKVRVTSPNNGLANGSTIRITGTTNYNGNYVITKIADTVNQLAKVDSVYNPTPVLPAPTLGVRYLSTATANGWTINRIYTGTGSAFTEYAPSTNDIVYIDASYNTVRWNGTAWVTYVKLDTFYITATWVVTETGMWHQGTLARVRADKVHIWLDNLEVAHDNGTGGWISPGGEVVGGSIDYVTGRVIVVFAAPPGAGQQVLFKSDVLALFMDQSDNTKIQDITIVKIGTGNKGGTPDPAMTDLEDPVPYVGTVESYEITNEKITFHIKVPTSQVLTNVSELGLYHSGTGRLMVLSFFPSYDKPAGPINEITVDVLRKQ